MNVFLIFFLCVCILTLPYFIFYRVLPTLHHTINDAVPLKLRVEISSFDESCFSTCRRNGLACDVALFELIDNCDILRQVMPNFKTSECVSHPSNDVPGYNRHYSQLQIHPHPSAHAPSCGARNYNTLRACPCKPLNPRVVNRPVHVVYSAEASDYMEWQARYDYFWFQRINWPQAKLTRLLATKEPHEIRVPTHVAPPYNWGSDVYKAYNKPLSLMHWLDNAKPTEDVIIIVDPDSMFIKPMLMQEIVEEGKPIAMKALFSFDYNWRDRNIVNRYSILAGKLCSQPDPIAVPVLIHRKDAERLAPLWLKWTELIRNDTEDGDLKWDPDWKKVSFSWTAEMFGYVFAACELGLRHDMWTDLQAIPGQNATDLRFHPTIHYHTPVWAAHHKWVKYPTDAHTNFIWPLDKVWFGERTPLVDKTFFEGMYAASRALYGLPDDDFVWTGSKADKLDEIVERNVAYRGCHVISRGDLQDKLINSVTRKVLRCVGSCTERAFRFAGLTRGSKCWCGNAFDKANNNQSYAPPEQCNSKCVDDNKSCGSKDSDMYIDVYESQKSKPFERSEIELIGCFNDDTGRRDMPKLKRLSAKSPGECLRLCVDADLPYAGLQMGQECWCGSKAPGLHGPAPDSACEFKYHL